MVFYFKKAYVQALLCLEICRYFKVTTKEHLNPRNTQNEVVLLNTLLPHFAIDCDCAPHVSIHLQAKFNNTTILAR